jgi:hypothetical protein
MSTTREKEEMMVNTYLFDSQLLSDGHLSCPQEFREKKNIQFKVLVIVEESDQEASDHEMEATAIRDTSDEYLSEEELTYYLKLAEL